MIIFCGSQAQISAKKRDSLRKFHRTYGLPLENYLSVRANYYRKCPTVRRPLGNTDKGVDGSMIQVFKIIKGNDDIPIEEFFQISESTIRCQKF